MGVVVFDYATWILRYPELAGVPEALANLYFAEAGLYLNNSPGSVVQDEPTRALLLNMVTAHIAKLNATIDGEAPSGLVGRVTQATEGTVTVATDYGTQGASAAFWLQTPYGAAFWQATARYRGARYIPGRPRFQGVPGDRLGTLYFGGGWGAPRWPR